MTKSQIRAVERFDAQSWWSKVHPREEGIDLTILLEIFDDTLFGGVLVWWSTEE